MNDLQNGGHPPEGSEAPSTPDLSVRTEPAGQSAVTGPAGQPAATRYAPPPAGYGRPVPPPAYQPPYQGGFPVRCPRCSHIVSTRFCTFCGTDLSTCYTVRPPAGQPAMPYSPPPPAGGYYGAAASAKKHTLRNTLLAVGIPLACLLLFVIFLFAFRRASAAPPRTSGGGLRTPAASEEYFYPQGISLEEYNQIEIGMSYARVSAIIGGDGQLVQSSQTISDETYYTYMWYGENSPYAAAYITFTAGAVSAIENEGLTNG